MFALTPIKKSRAMTTRLGFERSMIARFLHNDGISAAAAHGRARRRLLKASSQEPRAGFPLTLESKAAGLTKRSWIRISQIRTLSVDRIGARVARSSEEELARVLDGLNEILG